MLYKIIEAGVCDLGMIATNHSEALDLDKLTLMKGIAQIKSNKDFFLKYLLYSFYFFLMRFDTLLNNLYENYHNIWTGYSIAVQYYTNDSKD